MTFVLGQTPFAPTASWNLPVGSSPTYTKVSWPASNGYTYGVAWSSYSPAVFIASSTDPFVQVSCPATWGWPANPAFHAPVAANGANGTDGEVIIIDGDTVYNLYQFNRTSATMATASAWAKTSISTGTGWGTKSPFLAAGTTAAGSSLLAGLLVQAETDTGTINHALQIAIDGALLAANPVGEAINSDGGAGSLLQEGDRVAIPIQVAMPTGLSAIGQTVFKALQQYGGFIIDQAGGVTNLRAQANAYSGTLISQLSTDLQRIMPLTQKVKISPVVTVKPATVLNIKSTAYLQVVVKFSGPVTAQAGATISVGGYTGTLVSGSGTDTLTFQVPVVDLSRISSISGVLDATGQTPTLTF